MSNTQLEALISMNSDEFFWKSDSFGQPNSFLYLINGFYVERSTCFKAYWSSINKLEDFVLKILQQHSRCC